MTGIGIVVLNWVPVRIVAGVRFRLSVRSSSFGRQADPAGWYRGTAKLITWRFCCCAMGRDTHVQVLTIGKVRNGAPDAGVGSSISAVLLAIGLWVSVTPSMTRVYFVRFY